MLTLSRHTHRTLGNWGSRLPTRTVGVREARGSYASPDDHLGTRPVRFDGGQDSSGYTALAQNFLVMGWYSTHNSPGTF